VSSDDGKVVKLRPRHDTRLETAIKAFDSGDDSPDLFREFVDLIDHGFKEANYFVGCMYEDGTNGVEKNPHHALHYYQKSIEGYGYLEGYLAVARLLYHGDVVSRDYDKAFQYYEHVVSNCDSPVALFMLGRMYQQGAGVAQDLSKARSLFLRAMATGSVYAMINMALLEAQEGHWIRSLMLRARASVCTFLIARRNPRDARLRGG
jgi:TPR repeat protein